MILNILNKPQLLKNTSVDAATTVLGDAILLYH